MKFFKNNDCDIKVERGDRVFPKSDKAGDVIVALKKCIKNNKVKVLLNIKFLFIIVELNEVKEVVLYNEEAEKREVIELF